MYTMMGFLGAVVFCFFFPCPVSLNAFSVILIKPPLILLYKKRPLTLLCKAYVCMDEICVYQRPIIVSCLLETYHRPTRDLSYVKRDPVKSYDVMCHHSNGTPNMSQYQMTKETYQRPFICQKRPSKVIRCDVPSQQWHAKYESLFDDKRDLLETYHMSKETQ